MYGRLGLTPRQFGSLTPREVTLMLEGKADEVDDDWWRTAWATAHLMTMWSKKGKRVTAAQLLRWRKRRKPVEEQTEEAKFQSLWEAVQAKRKREQEPLPAPPLFKPFTIAGE